jgi:DNA-binding MarR family transcriptional regulator
MEDIGRHLGIDQCHATTLRKASRRVSQFYDHKLLPFGIRATQFAILATLSELPGLAINQLADHLDLDKTTTGKNLRPLEKAGLVNVVTSERDGRSRTISLTAEGLATLEGAMPLWREAQAQFEQLNGSETAATLRARLNELRVT